MGVDLSMLRLFLSKSVLRQLGAGGESSNFSVQARNIGELVALMSERFPSFGDSIFDELGQVRQYVNVFVNGRNIREDELPLNTLLEDDDRVHIFPSVAGGSG